MPHIEIRDVSLIYDTPAGRVAGVQGATFNIEQSEFVCIVGPSGCGKSTLLNIIAGFIPPTSGEIRIGGKAVSGYGQDRGVVFQDFAQLFPWRTALGNVAFGLEMRGVGKSEGGGSRQWDSYDLIEWIAKQPWCDGKIGMVGISGFGAEQFHVAKQQPPSLKAIFPFDPRGAYGTLGSFREEYPGGVLHLFRYLVGHFSAMHQNRGAPGPLPEPRETWWREALALTAWGLSIVCLAVVRSSKRAD